MRKNHIMHGSAAVLLLCVAVALISVGLFTALNPRPSSDSSVLAAEELHPDTKLPDFNAEVTPEETTHSKEPPPLPAGVPSDTNLQEEADPSDSTPSPEPSGFPGSPEEESPEPLITSLPVRMRIPALALDYEIQGTGADASGTMQIVPALKVISWFMLSSIPGNKGNAILGGHNSWHGERSRIYTLDSLEIGDELEIVYADGTSLKFRMESVFVYPLATAPAHLIMDVRGEARLTLITCKGPFNTTTGTSDNRIVATFREDSVFVVPDPPIKPFPPKGSADSRPTPPDWLLPVISAQ